MRVRTFVVTGVLLAAVTGTLVACGSGDNGGTAVHRPTTTVATPPPTTAASTTAPAGTASRPAPTSAAPAAVAFRVDLTIQHAGLGLLALTNTTKRSVTVHGWPTLSFYNAADETVAVPVRKVDVPGAGPSITVGPGETAFAGVRWTVGDKANPKTFVATTLLVAPPGGTGPAVVNVIGEDGQNAADAEFDLTSAEIGTLQPSSQGVLVF